MTSIDDELFDLEKKYGEFKRPKVIVTEQIEDKESNTSSPVII